MLEVNDFDAIRISLASPEQIRSWSYGEVTKPETINYRTLKPEKDGLFCERIFGPSKDWECYCGKYKRVRFKGIVCDKCGVEVARSKVRRERMGHIELASPVSHIWYFKGTPSRIGLLLDLSPRNLERILYFALYVVTRVNEDVRAQALESMNEGVARQLDERQAEVTERIRERQERRDAIIAELERQVQQTRENADAHRTDMLQTARDEDRRVRAILRDNKDQVLTEDLFYEVTDQESGEVTKERIAQQGEVAGPAALERLDEIAQKHRDGIAANAREEVEQSRANADREAERERMNAEGEITAIQDELLQQTDGIQAQMDARRRDMESLKRLDLLTEQRFRELRDFESQLLGYDYDTPIFEAGMGAEAVQSLLADIDLDQLATKMRSEIKSTSGQRSKKAAKRLNVVEAFRKSGNRPEWMVLSVLPVLPPDLRPMVQLDGGRFATSDLNDLYRRVINRNNRLKRLLELGAPEIIIRNEKRMLQEACDALIDNGRRGRAVAGSGNHKLKSLSDMLKGKQGRFRQNLLGKRVDYSGRSVIVVGPDLKLHQCGLPKKMALELFKPFVMRKLVEQGLAHNIKSAKRFVERIRPEVWDVLEEVIRDHPVLLNRAPTLHRLGIQAFDAVLVEGSAIQLHPLVCSAFNADFDGDQMAVHVPLSERAQEEARTLMLSSRNILAPATGEPSIGASQDMVLGCYYLTMDRTDFTKDKIAAHDLWKQLGVTAEMTSEEIAKKVSDDDLIRYKVSRVFADTSEALMAYTDRHVKLQESVFVRLDSEQVYGEPGKPVSAARRIKTTVGRILFNEALPEQLRFKNYPMNKENLRRVIAECFKVYGRQATADLADEIKRLGFSYATRAGASIAISDVTVPPDRESILNTADQQIAQLEQDFQDGLITEMERYQRSVQKWNEVTDRIQDRVRQVLDRYGPIYTIADSGATKAKFQQIRQLSGMRGLMADPSGRIMELPVRGNFRDGLTVMEYFISSHGARKGLADTALRTAESGYLTRRLIDVAQDVIVLSEDCGTTEGVWVTADDSAEMQEPFRNRLMGRILQAPVADFEHIAVGMELEDDTVDQMIAAGVKQVYCRSVLQCLLPHGVCRLCYGRNLGSGKLVEIGDAVGIIAAQSIGEPGTQLTMRTFHTGGIAGAQEDITQGLPRVEELFEARIPKDKAIISEIDGAAELIVEDSGARKLRVVAVDLVSDEYPLPKGSEVLVREGDEVQREQVIARMPAEAGAEKAPRDIVARSSGQVFVNDDRLVIRFEGRDEREYPVPAAANLTVGEGEQVRAGMKLTQGLIDPQDVLRIQGRDAVHLYLVKEVQRVYRSTGVYINDKHIETIVRQMLRRVRIDDPGDTDLLPSDLEDRFHYEETNARVLAEGGDPATAQTVLLGVTKASLNTESFLSAASFQETTRVLTEAAINGSTDHLLGLKENVIIGKLIPAGRGLEQRKQLREKQRQDRFEIAGANLPAFGMGSAGSNGLGSDLDAFGAFGMDGNDVDSPSES